MKRITILVSVIIIIAIIFGVKYYLDISRKVKIYEEYEVYSERETWGLAWNIISDENTRQVLMEKFGIEIPRIDFNKNYLLMSDGRRIKEITYKISSKYKWQYNVPKGIATFEGKHHPHTVFIYKINKVLVKQEGD